MDLLLWRHAEAEDGFPDLQRKLTARGEKQARKMADWILEHAPKNLRIVVSPALRCQQTAQALGRPFETERRIGTDGNAVQLLTAVGCVIVADGVIVGEGVTGIGGRPHAEEIALKAAGDKANGATAYVTLEPCAHHGRTPPCANALVNAGIARVVGAASDPDDRVAGKGYAILRQAGITVTEGVLADVMARYQRLAGNEVYFLTGVDQHGQKVQQKAAEAGQDGRSARQ